MEHVFKYYSRVWLSIFKVLHKNKDMLLCHEQTSVRPSINPEWKENGLHTVVLSSPHMQARSPTQIMEAHTKHKFLFLFKNHGAREMAQRLRTLAALAEDLGSVPSTHIVTHNCLVPVPPSDFCKC